MCAEKMPSGRSGLGDAWTLCFNAYFMRKRIFGVLAFTGLVSCSSSSPSTGAGSSSSSSHAGSTGTSSSSSTGSGSSGGIGSCGYLGGGTMTWLLNGESECTTYAMTTRTTDSSMDFIEIVGSTSTAVGIGVTVASYTGPLSGTYTCSESIVDGGATVIFVYGSVNVTECTITITQAGSANVNAQGTFSASGAFIDGGTANITDGTFDVAVTVTDGG